MVQVVLNGAEECFDADPMPHSTELSRVFVFEAWIRRLRRASRCPSLQLFHESRVRQAAPLYVL
jgi:hypothetical protein